MCVGVETKVLIQIETFERFNLLLSSPEVLFFAHMEHRKINSFTLNK